MQKLFNMARVQDAAAAIADELTDLLDRDNVDSPVYRRIRETPAYRSGLTNGEHVVATLRALNMVSAKVVDDLASLIRMHGDEVAGLSALVLSHEDEDIAA